MGACSSNVRVEVAAAAPGPAPSAQDAPSASFTLIEGSEDPRYDVAAMDARTSAGDIVWVRVGFLRRLKVSGGRIMRRQDCPPEAHHPARPLPLGCQRYMVSWSWHSKSNPDPSGMHLAHIVEALDGDQADDADAVAVDFMSLYQRRSDEDDRTPEQRESFKRALKAWDRAFIHFRHTFIISACVPADMALVENSRPHFARGWTVQEFNLASFSTRLLYAEADAELVLAHLTPEWIMNFDRLITEGVATGEVAFTNASDTAMVRALRQRVGEKMEPARTSAVGFVAACLLANYRWVRVAYLRKLAARGGPAPRRQDLPAGTYVDGLPPLNQQRWVASYPWAAHKHFSPSGAKVREFVAALDEFKAHDEDVVFLDFMSLWQGAKDHTVPTLYAELNQLEMRSAYGEVTVPEKSPAESKLMLIALYETTRLYAFAGGHLPNGQLVSGCRVVVLPDIEEAASFPDGGGVQIKLNAFCTPPRQEEFTAWGFRKSIPYEEGGWTSAEYTIARKNGTIVNAHHAAVRRVEAAGPWPEDVRQFAEMMRRVVFTKKGDAAAVRFNFYRYAYHFLDA